MTLDLDDHLFQAPDSLLTTLFRHLFGEVFLGLIRILLDFALC